jgi:aldose sugar dehydrogenase
LIGVSSDNARRSRLIKAELESFRDYNMQKLKLGCWLLMFVSLYGLVSVVSAQTLNDPNLRVTELVAGLSQPTAMAFIASNDLLVLQKNDGRVRRVINGALQPGEVLDIHVDNQSERGLLGIALHPNFPGTNLIYLYYTESSAAGDTSGSPLANRVYRYTWNGSALINPQLILDLPATPGPNHDGGAMTFGPDGKLYVIIGDLNRNGQLQNFSSGSTPDNTGVIFRVNADGTAPSDNPFASQPDLAKYYAYGIRNSFGLAFDPLTGELWDTENGPNAYDEINIVLRGFNSGWERIMGPVNRDPQGTGDLVQFPGSQYADPNFSWFNPAGPTAIVFFNSGQLGAEYQNDVFVGDINNGHLYRFKLNSTRNGFLFQDAGLADLVADNSSELQEVVFGTGFGGITDLEIGPDGVLYVLSFEGKIFAVSRPSTFTPSETPLVNISTRGSVGTGDNLLIAGFVIDGNASKTVLVRGRGPSMSAAPFFVSGALANPLLRLFSGQAVIAQNDQWQDSPSCNGFVCGDAAQIAAADLDPCQANPGQSSAPPGCALEAAILITLNPGAYTVHLSGVGGGTGIGLIEVFDADGDTTVQFVNLSTRSLVQTGNNVVIGGFVIDGNGPKTVMMRGRGSSMSGAPFFVSGVLANPSLRLFSAQAVIAENDNWQDSPSCTGFVCGGAAQIAVTGQDPCQPNPGQSSAPPGCTLESAILITLDPGAYTVHLTGADSQTGTGLVEIFQIQN